MFEEKHRACFGASEAAPALATEITDRSSPSAEPEDDAPPPRALTDWIADGSLPG